MVEAVDVTPRVGGPAEIYIELDGSSDLRKNDKTSHCVTGHVCGLWIRHARGGGFRHVRFHLVACGFVTFHILEASAVLGYL